MVDRAGGGRVSRIGLTAVLKGPANVAPPLAPPEGNTLALANVMFREYLLPFELASALLLVAIVGAVVMARKEKPTA